MIVKPGIVKPGIVNPGIVDQGIVDKRAPEPGPSSWNRRAQGILLPNGCASR